MLDCTYNIERNFIGLYRLMMNNLSNTKVRVAEGNKWSLMTICSFIIPSSTSLILTLFLVGSLMINGWVRPIVRRGFFCGDSTINFPFKQETITFGTLLLIALFIPSLVIKLCDNQLHRLIESSSGCSKLLPTCRRRKDSGATQHIDDVEENERLMSNAAVVKRRNLVLNEDDSDYELIDAESSRDNQQRAESSDGDSQIFNQVSLDDDNNEENVHKTNGKIEILKQKYSETQLFIFGLATTMLFTGIGKLAGGRFRPHFMQRCQPDIDCSLEANANKYIDQFTCTNQQLRPKDFSYITTSWPSGEC